MDVRELAESIPKRISWRRLFVEAVAIVGSILLAFAIDAWWADRQDELEGERLANALAAEVAENLVDLDNEIKATNELIERSRDVLDAIAGVEPVSPERNGLADIGNIFVMRSWYLTNNIYMQSVASGKLLLINSETLRFSLADYHSLLADLVVIVGNIETQYYMALEPFLTKHTVYTEVAHSAWLKGLPTPPFSTDFDSLARNTELWNLLAFRLELDLAYLARLERARNDGAELADALLAYASR